MPKGISLSIASDTRQFMAGVKSGVIDPLADVETALDDMERAGESAGSGVERSMQNVGDSLDDVGRSADDAGDKLESSLDGAGDALDNVGRAGDDAGDKLEDSMRRAQRETDDSADAIKDLKRKLDDAGREAKSFGDKGRDAGRDFERGMDRASDGVNEFRDEANSTAREAAASFDGSAESIGDAIQEVTANAFAGFGPAGAVAGLAAAAGIGLAIAGFEAVGEANEESQARIDEWASTYIEAGGRILDASTYIAAANAILTDSAQYETATKNAELWGVTVETAVAAMTGQHDALAEAQRNVAQAAAEEAEAMEGLPYDDVGTNLANLNSRAGEAQRALNGVTGEMDAGAERASIMSAYLVDLARNTEGATREVDEFGDSVYTLPDGTTVYVDAETGRATQNVDAIERRIYGIPDGHARVDVSVNDAAVDRYMRRSLVRQATVNVVVRGGERLWY